MSKPKAPKPPDPKVVAAGQTATNIGTATANAYLNNVNQVGPDGNITYAVDGYTAYTDPLDGKVYQIPKWTQTTSLSPHGEALQGVNNQTELNLANLGQEQSSKLQTLLGQPVDLSNDAVEGRLFDLGRKRLDPEFAIRDEALRTRLANQGIRAGSEAYDAEMRRFGENQNDAYNQLLLTGRGQAVQEQLQSRNQPINEITALMSGSQVSLPQFGSTNQYGIPTVDYAGLVNNNYDQQMGIYNNKMAQQNAMYGGLFGIAGAAAGNPEIFSDERLKENIEDVGETNDGQTIYSYNYKGDDRPQMGLIAQEVEKKHPEAVKRHSSGFLMVDMGKALSEARI